MQSLWLAGSLHTIWIENREILYRLGDNYRQHSTLVFLTLCGAHFVFCPPNFMSIKFVYVFNETGNGAQSFIPMLNTTYVRDRDWDICISSGCHTTLKNISKRTEEKCVNHKSKDNICMLSLHICNWYIVWVRSDK